MPSPLPRLTPLSHKKTVALAAVLLLLLVTSAVILYQRSRPVVQTINYTQLHALGASSTVASLNVEGEVITVTATNGAISQAVVTNQAAQQEIAETFRKNNVPVEFHPSRSAAVAATLNWLIPVLTLVAFGFVGWRVYASMGGRGGGFRLVDANGKQDVSFDDVAGVDETKAELSE